MGHADTEYPAGRESHVVIMTHDARDWMQCMDFDVDDIVYVKPAEPFLASYATVMARFMRTCTANTNLRAWPAGINNAIVTAAEYGALLHFMEAAESRTELLPGLGVTGAETAARKILRH